MAAPDPSDDPWARVVGQDRAVEQLQRAVDRPVHAYLFVGLPGAGMEEAAQAFAASLVGAEGDRVARGRHPDVVEFEPEGVEYRVAEVREQIIPEITAAPVESSRKVVILHEVERLNEPSANALLKSLEEPPDWTHLVLLTANAEELLETVRSRCLRVEFTAVPVAIIADVLRARGVDADRAAACARAAGGRLDRAIALAGPLAPLRDAFRIAIGRLDGTGRRAAELAGDLGVALDAAVAAAQAEQATELEELDAEIATVGYSARVAQAMRKRLTERHKRRARRARVAALLEGFAAIEASYRDTLASVPEAPAVAPRSAVAALDRLRHAREAVLRNASEGLLLEHLLLHLPASGAGIEALAGSRAR